MRKVIVKIKWEKHSWWISFITYYFFGWWIFTSSNPVSSTGKKKKYFIPISHLLFCFQPFYFYVCLSGFFFSLSCHSVLWVSRKTCNFSVNSCNVQHYHLCTVRIYVLSSHYEELFVSFWFMHIPYTDYLLLMIGICN